ncbi:MAG: Gfo/Idh/MocA family oxidoreductase [Phycisphaerae bacterium]|nr:Gfo/Idh/MocA family oxidoreductase [Phycisphaerae bacterium]MCZ2398373.1 Gfo/Idh/MocA family oxidoreductase [Phycisphaerae bacterium]NUQ48849.1 Gfo/Idh/MocA family oxidoreductase [Phycisphaerae bacterium]
MSGICNVALLGQKFMGRAHSNAYLKVDKFFNVPIRPVMHTIAGLDLISLAPFASRWGWKNYSTSWKEVVKDPNVHLVDVSTPNYMHADQALAALSNGKHVACEKPLADTLKDARAMKSAAARASKCRTFVWYNYRRCPAVALAHQLVREGRIGRIYHVRAQYLQSWGVPETPLVWRFQKKYAGSGAHGDLNAHIIDMARFVTGQEIVEVNGAVAETFVTHREVPEPPAKPIAGRTRSAATRKKTMGKSDVDDCVLFLARLSGGGVASFEASRLAIGHQNNNMIEINGEHGALRFSFEDMNLLWYYDAREEARTAGWRRIMCTSARNHPYAGAWWPDAHVIGYEHTFVNMVADMMAVLAGEEPIVPLPTFADAYETQRVLEAALMSAKERSAIKLSEVK